jgi:hypothetical protein
MRLAACCSLALIAIAAMHEGAWAQEEDDSVRAFAVHIDRTPKQSWIGEGVYLGNGFVISAAHVTGVALWRRPRVDIHGTIFPATAVKDGHFHNVDLTLLSVDVRQIPVSLGLRHMTLCKTAPRPGEPVVVATPDGVAQSQVLPPARLPPGLPMKFRTAIAFVPHSGASGSGVFDANRKCLLGIITRLITEPGMPENGGRPQAVAKYFIPASRIEAFLPAGIQF